MEEPKVSPNPKSTSRKLFESAVEDAQFMVAYAAGKCKRDIDERTLTTIITAKRRIDENQPIDAKSEAEFWLAYQYIWKLVTPSTAESIKANLPIESPFVTKLLRNVPALYRWVETKTTSKSRKSVNRYIFFTVLVLFVVLLLQIYWVIGNQLTTHLADILQRETDLSLQINENREEYSAIEIRFKQGEADSESFRANGTYTFYSSPEWERDTLNNLSAKAQLETELESLKAQLNRSSEFWRVWSKPWEWLIKPKTEEQYLAELDQYDPQINSINRQIDELAGELRKDPTAFNQIQAAQDQVENIQKELTELQKEPEANSDQIVILRAKMQNITDWLYQPGLADQIVSQLTQDMERLKREKDALERQQKVDINREISRQAQLTGQFVLVILQSYLLPLLYGILGARTSVLRSLSKEIENVTFSEEAGIQHLLRVSLGALSGIMVGWFSFLIPGETTTFVGSISPLAIAFLVGYNIELFFSMMDRALYSINDRLKRPSSTVEETAVSPSDSALPPVQAPPATETPIVSEPAG